MNTQTIHEVDKTLQFAKFPAIGLFFSILSERGVDFDIQRCEQGSEIHFKNEIHGNENRSFLRIFFPSATKCILFFHKKSQVPFSRDRFSYGGVIIDEKSNARFTKSDVEEWYEFLLTGFQPRKRPSTLKKSIPYTIPKDSM